MLNSKRTATVAAALALAGAVPAPSALAAPQNLQSPDAQDAAQGRYLGPSPVYQDFRSGDARDAADPQAPSVAESPPAESTGFDWASAGIGAAAGTGLIVLALGLGTGGRRRTLARHG
jgi:hypothetical protein